MSFVPSIRLSEDVFEKASEICKEEGITIEVFVTRAVEEKASAWKKLQSLKERANRASREKFTKALSKVPNVEPEEHDSLK